MDFYAIFNKARNNPEYTESPEISATEELTSKVNSKVAELSSLQEDEAEAYYTKVAGVALLVDMFLTSCIGDKHE